MLGSTGVALAALLGSAVLSLPSALAAPATRQAPLKFNYGGSEKVRGVNLGGWFVLEPWITPSLFDAQKGAAVDEYTLTQHLGKDAAKSTLEQHWSTFYTQADFQRIAASGLNHVRIPIGYWAVTPNTEDPYVQGAYDHLAKALDWAKAANLKVIIDLHGGPGSQNGFDNSGKRGPIAWSSAASSVDQTLNALRKIRDDHAAHPAVAAIELINEPMGPKIDQNVLKQFYYDGWGNLQNRGVAITFHEAFLGPAYWNDFGKGLADLLLDTHHYEVFDQGQLAMSPDAHVESACAYGATTASSNKAAIVGEFTGAMQDCAYYLNGFGIGARYDGTFNFNGVGSSYQASCDGYRVGSVSQWTQKQRDDTTRFVEAQLDGYEKAAGWVWWTWKTETGAPGWDLTDLIDHGVFPQPITARKYPGQCN